MRLRDVSRGSLIAGRRGRAAGTDEPASYTLIAAFLLLVLTILVHFAAFAFGIVTALRGRANVD
jgi:hypothetical protein